MFIFMYAIYIIIKQIFLDFILSLVKFIFL